MMKSVQKLFILTAALTAAFGVVEASVPGETGRAKTLRQACDDGNANNCIELAEMYATGDVNGEPDFDQASRLIDQALNTYSEACDSGDVFACVNLAVIYDRDDLGFGIQNRKLAANFYHKACDGGNGYACNRLAVFYKNGFGVEQSFAQAINFYRRACDLGRENGCLFIRQMEAAQALRQACADRNANSCLELAKIYRMGNGVEQSWEQLTTSLLKPSTYIAKPAMVGTQLHV